MKSRAKWLCGAVVSLVVSTGVWAQAPASENQSAASPAQRLSAGEVPRLIKFSGTLLDAQDRPLAGPVGVTFALHAQQSGGAALWIETQNVTPDAHGNYTVLLGANSANGVPAELFVSGEARWLGIQVGQQPEHERILLVSVPYALKAGDAETLGGLPASAFVTTGTPGNTGNAGGTAAATSASSTALPTATTPKKAASTPQAATPCSSITSDGAAAVSSIALFTTACNIESSVITQSSGNVGFGTATPAVAVDVLGNNAGLRLNGTGTHQVTVTSTTTGVSGRLGQDANGFFFASDTNGKSVRFLTNNGALNEWMRITSAGNIGIGTTTPVTKLEVNGPGFLMARFTNNGTGTDKTAIVDFLNGDTTSTLWRMGVGGTGNGLGLTGGQFYLERAGAGALMTVTSAGNVGIGITTPVAKLDVNGSLNLPNTASATVGVISLGSTPFVHNFGIGNTFLGLSAGNFTMTGQNNSAVGDFSLTNNTTGNHNTVVGQSALSSNSTGSTNTAVGRGALAFNSAGNSNTAVGAFSLTQNTTGGDNTAVGEGALNANTASGNAAFGSQALSANTTGGANVAFGMSALQFNTTGCCNSAFGSSALQSNTTGVQNSAFGPSALQNLTSGGFNIAIGSTAGLNLTTGSNNIYIGNSGSIESNAIRIGDPATQTATFVAGIRGMTTGQSNAVAVLIDSNGQLGTVSSSRRFKYDIDDMGNTSNKLLRLRPVTFRYKQAQTDGSHPLQYGLIAEQVAEVFPELVAYDRDGQPESVMYHVLPAMLLNEVQKQRQLLEKQRLANEQQQRENSKQRQLVTKQKSTIARQQAQIQDLATRLAKLEALVALARLGR